MNPATRHRRLTHGLVLFLLIFGAGIASAEQAPDLHKQLKDPSPAVRLKAARTLAEANDAKAIPVLIDLLAELSAEERRSVEELLTALAGEWAPSFPQAGEDEITRKLRRDVWQTWWRDTDGPSLLRLVRQHALTPEVRQKVRKLVRQLGDDDFASREAAVKELHQIGRVALPALRQARASKDSSSRRRGGYGQRRRQGTTYALFDSECVVMDAAGKRKQRFDVKLPIVNPGCLDVLPSGHIRAASRSTQRVFELDASGKVIWEHSNAGKAYRARRR